MARCPNCSYRLRLIDVKAECPVCKVNIPNFNWEGRLEEDAVKAESAWASFRRKTGSFKNALFGNKFRIARFALTFAPLLFLLFPMFQVTDSLPFSDGTQSVSMLSLILSIVNGQLDIGSLLGFLSFEKSGTAFLLLYLSVAFVVLSIVFGVLNFFVLLISGVGYHAKGNIALCVLSVGCTVAAIGCVIASSVMMKTAIPDVVSVKLSYALFIALVLFTVNLIMNTVARKQFVPEQVQYRKAAIAELQKKLGEAA